MLADHPVFGEPAEVGVADREGLAGGRHAHELALLRARDLAERSDHVAFGDHEVGGEMHVGKGADQHRHELLEAFTARRELRREGGVVVGPVGGQQLVGCVHVVAVHDLVVEALEIGGIAVGIHPDRPYSCRLSCGCAV